MIVLVVDDQISVVSAILSGVNWKSIGVHKVLKAYNAFEAKEILRMQPVDILICDIEMPAEDGLSLFRWTVENKYVLECIFLTSHADFHYAKEALQLGGFDYILQPARYEDIQLAVKRAIAHLIDRQENEKFCSYGKLVVHERGLLYDSILGKWLYQEFDYKKLQEALQSLNVNLDIDKRFSFALLQILHNNSLHSQKTEYDDLFRYGITNILTEVSGDYGQQILLIKFDDGSYALFCYNAGKALEQEVFRRLLEKYMELCQRYFKCTMAAYISCEQGFDTLAQNIQKLKAIRDNNVILASRIFSLGEVLSKPADFEYAFNQQRWDSLVSMGDFQAVKAEINSSLNLMADKELLNMHKLYSFHQEFLHWVVAFLKEQHLGMDNIVPDFVQQKMFSSAYQSLAQTREMVDFILNALELLFTDRKKAENQVDAMLLYIHENLEKDIRRSDLAEAVYLSPDYVSHLFSQKVGMPLSDYVTQEKMKAAKALLRSSNLPVSVIAVKVGYSNFSYFSKTYKKIYGVSPASERKAESENI